MHLHRRTPIHALVAVALATVALAGCGSSEGRGESQQRDGKLRVTDSRVEEPANPSVAAAYFSIRNGTDVDDALEGVSTEAAAKASVHRSTIDDEGRSTMDPVPSLEVPAGSTVSLETGGLHLMLNDVTADLRVGDEVTLILHFREAGDVRVEAPVVELGSQPTGDVEEDADHDH